MMVAQLLHSKYVKPEKETRNGIIIMILNNCENIESFVAIELKTLI